MKRRRYLTTIVAGTGLLSGCISSSPNPAEEPPSNANRTQTTSSGTRHNRDIQRRVSLAEVDEIPDKHNLRIEVDLLKSSVTDTHTAHLRLTATDETSRKRRITIGTGQCSLFNRLKGQSEPPGLWLLIPERIDSDPPNNRWTVDRDAFAMYGCGYLPTVHNEPIINKYRVWDDADVGGYMTPGTYRFATSITVGSRPLETNTATTTESATDFTWGFSLTVENPNR